MRWWWLLSFASFLCLGIRTFALHKDSDEIWISILILDDILIRFYAIVFQHTNLCTRRGSFVQQLNSFEKFIRAPNTVSTRKRDTFTLDGDIMAWSVDYIFVFLASVVAAAAAWNDDALIEG